MTEKKEISERKQFQSKHTAENALSEKREMNKKADTWKSTMCLPFSFKYSTREAAENGRHKTPCLPLFFKGE